MEHFSYKGVCGVHKRTHIEMFKRVELSLAIDTITNAYTPYGTIF